MDKPPPFKFDENGYLTASEIIETDLKTTEQIFVNSFPKSKTRRLLFQNFQRFADEFSREIFPFFEVWLNGSFTTQKLNPNDLDLTVFLDAAVFELRERSGRLEKFYSFSLEPEKLDSYIIPVFPENHSEFDWFESAKANRKALYSHSRPVDEFGTRLQKGFIKLIFEK